MGKWWLILCLWLCSCGKNPQETQGEISEPIKEKIPEIQTLPAKTKEPQIKKDIVFGFSLAADKLTICENIFNQFITTDKTTLSANMMKNRFTVEKDLSGSSKSGAFPSLVKDSDGKIKFLKIFQGIAKNMSLEQIVADQSFLELFHSCMVAKLNLTANLPAHIMASIFFPKVFEFGFLKTMDPFTKSEGFGSLVYPFLLGEAIKNITLTELAKNPVKAKQMLGFDFYSAPPLVIESILLQIIVALKNANLAWDMTHNDLHTGNILLAADEKANFAITFENKEMQLAGPLVKIIDFGLAKSDRFSHGKGIWISYRPFIKELDDFISEFRGKYKMPILDYLGIYMVTTNQDIRMFNLILTALKPILARRQLPIKEGKYCKDYDDCIQMLSAWWP